MLLSAVAGTGVAVGYAASKLNAAGKQDYKDAEKAYGVERTGSDIDYLKARLREEAKPLLEGAKAARPKSVRML
ncbi:MAG: hypothetical protein IJJ33_07590 [Victivallales bacterium]|nr:hypothetical protein [Victivallales bacterium]